MSEGFALYGRDLFGDPIEERKGMGPLAKRFEFPPFSVLNAREGEWQARKAAWIRLGIQSELGRDGVDYAIGDKAEWDKTHNHAAPGGSALPAANYANRERGSGSAIPGTSANDRKPAFRPNQDLPESTQRKLGGYIAKGAVISRYDGTGATGTSVFDPVLCELAYKWFCPPGGQVIDPFAGGSVRGIVAGLLGYRYHGIDLRAEQIGANEEQRAAIAPEADVVWRCGDSRNLLADAPQADFLFSCPPYGDLERYSDDPADLSTMAHAAFLEAYAEIIGKAAARLKQNRLACFVVGDFRDRKTGLYRGFVADTVRLFRESGLELYNDAVLLTAVGSLPIRVAGQFPKGRKLGKTHQNVLVFAKGDPREAFRE